MLSDVSTSERDFHLGPRPGRRIRSGVVPPEGTHKSDATTTVVVAAAAPDKEMVDLDDLT